LGGHRAQAANFDVDDPNFLEKTVYYNGPSEAAKAAARAEFCKKVQYAKEIPMDAPPGTVKETPVERSPAMKRRLPAPTNNMPK